MIPIGTLFRGAVRFSGEATSISAAAYVNGSLSAVSVTLGSPADQGSPAQTYQPFTWVTTGLADGDEIEIRVAGTVSAATETHNVYERMSTLVGSRSTYAGGAADTNAAAIKAKTDLITQDAVDGAARMTGPRATIIDGLGDPAVIVQQDVPTAAEVAAAILVTPAQKIVTDINGKVTTSNPSTAPSQVDIDFEDGKVVIS